ncbi:zinc carboxypeptidase [Hermetia illucens]|nr:zinc carboxypeptidase [Hermetia illucens]
MRAHYILVVLLAIVAAYPAKVVENQARFDNYRIYRLHLAEQKQVEVFQEVERRSDSYQFYGHPEKIGQKVNVLVAAHKIAEITDLLETYEVEHEILTYNFQEKIDKETRHILSRDASPDKFDWDHFFHLETMYDWIEQLAKDNDKVSVITLGKSHEGRDIKGIRIGNNPKKTSVFLESGIHAREWIAPCTATYIINELISSQNETIKKYAEEFNWFIFPVFNVDGYLYTFNHDRMWRKNRNLFGVCRGVDLNRNYPYRWNETGSSPDPCRYDFAGPAAGSEEETKSLMKFIKDHVLVDRIKTFISLHSYSQLIMFPYGTPEQVSNFDDLDAIGKKAAQTIEETSGQKYKSGSIYKTIYPSSGCSQDWARNVTDIPIAFTFELRGPPSSPDLFILPYEQIRPTAEEIFAAIRTILTEADKLGYYSD